jgi:hypothetical protein
MNNIQKIFVIIAITSFILWLGMAFNNNGGWLDSDMIDELFDEVSVVVAFSIGCGSLTGLFLFKDK